MAPPILSHTLSGPLLGVQERDKGVIKNGEGEKREINTLRREIK